MTLRGYIQHSPGRSPALPRGLLKQHLAVLGAGLGLLGGLTASLLGALVLACSWWPHDAALKSLLEQAGSVLLCLTIPLLLAGATCLDWYENERKKEQ